MADLCPFCDGEGRIGTLICEACHGRKYINLPPPTNTIPKQILNSAPGTPIPQDIAENEQITKLEIPPEMPQFLIPKTPIGIPPVRPANIPMISSQLNFPIPNNGTILPTANINDIWNIYLDLREQIRGDKNKNIIDKVFKRYGIGRPKKTVKKRNKKEIVIEE